MRSILRRLLRSIYDIHSGRFIVSCSDCLLAARFYCVSSYHSCRIILCFLRISRSLVSISRCFFFLCPFLSRPIRLRGCLTCYSANAALFFFAFLSATSLCDSFFRVSFFCALVSQSALSATAFTCAALSVAAFTRINFFCASCIAFCRA